MKFIKTNGVALLVTVLLVISLAWIGTEKISLAADARYYKQWIVDDADILSEETIQELADFNERLDDTFGSIIGLVTVQSLDEKNIVDYSFGLFHNYGFGENDLMILLSLDEQAWYVADGDVMAGNYPNSLRIALQEQFTGKGLADEDVLEMYQLAAQWYEDNVPHNTAGNRNRNRSLRGADVIVGFTGLLAAGFVLLLLFRYLVWPIFRYNKVGAWKPLWGWGILGPISVKRKKN